MNIRTITSSPASTDIESARIVVAIELSKKNWLVGLLTPLAHKISLHTAAAGDS